MAGLATLDPGAATFGGDGPGVLGELGRDLHHHWQRALDARAREAAAHGARLDDAADVVARAAADYADTDDTARGRRTGGGLMRGDALSRLESAGRDLLAAWTPH